MLSHADKPKFLAVDFYCGAGGTTRGLLDAGGYVIAGIDKDEDCEVTYRSNNRNTILDNAEPDFLALDMLPATADYPQGQRHEVGNALNELIPRYRQMAQGAPLLFAICAPCQSFTKFVQRSMTDKRTEDRRRSQNLLAQTVGFIKAFQPEMIISENVAAIVSGQYKHIWNNFQEDLRKLGYAVSADIVCASRFGVPQRRRRSVIIALRDSDSALDLPIPHSAPDAAEISAYDAIKHLPPLNAGESHDEFANHVCRNLSETNRRRLMSVKPGQSNFGFAETRFGDLSLACHRRLSAKGTRGFGDVYTRMRPDRPSPTITTGFLSVSKGRFGHCDTNQVRGLSLREGAALQSFPDHYKFYGKGMDANARMIGNAVPPKLSAYMARWTLGLWTTKDMA